MGPGSDSPKPASNNFLFNMFTEHLLCPQCQAVCQALGSGDEWILVAPVLWEWPIQEGRARKQTSAVSASREQSRAQTCPDAVWGVVREKGVLTEGGTRAESEDDDQGSPGEREEGHCRQRYDLQEA